MDLFNDPKIKSMLKTISDSAQESRDGRDTNVGKGDFIKSLIFDIGIPYIKKNKGLMIAVIIAFYFIITGLIANGIWIVKLFN